MAKLKISGFNELLSISQEKAQEIRRMWLDPEIAKDHRFSVGNFAIIKGDIRAILLENETSSENPVEAQNQKYYAERDKLVALSPEERAKKNSWGHFKLFYWGLFGKVPDEDMRERVSRVAAKFFKENPHRVVPDYELYFEEFNFQRDQAVNAIVKRILENTERRDREDAVRYVEFHQMSKSFSKPEDDIF